MWLVHQFEDDDCSAARFVQTIAAVKTEAEADAVIAKAPKAKSLVTGYCYTKQRMDGRF